MPGPPSDSEPAGAPRLISDLARVHDLTPEALRGRLRHHDVPPVAALLDSRGRAALGFDPAAVARALAPRPAPPGLGTSDLARELGYSRASIRAWAVAGMPHRTVDGCRRFEVADCRAWLANRKRRGRRARGRAPGDVGTINVCLSMGCTPALRAQLVPLAQRLDVSMSTLLREGVRVLLARLRAAGVGVRVPSPERLGHLLEDHPFRRAQSGE